MLLSTRTSLPLYAHFQLKIKMYRRLYSRDPLSLNRAISLVEILRHSDGEIKSPRFNILRIWSSVVVVVAAAAEQEKTGRVFA